MIFHDTAVDGAYLIDLERRGDERGFFARLFCDDEFTKAKLHPTFRQINTSFSVKKGTLRGMHYQLSPDEEVKVVRCTRGSLWDVVLDLRSYSRTYGQWYAAELTEDNRSMMYVPKGCAHGFITLEPNTEALYLVSTPYSPKMERGVRYNDPQFNISWPIQPTELSEKDLSWPNFVK